MTSLIFDKTKDDPGDFWTTERLKEACFLCLANIKEKIYNDQGKPVTVRKYYAQARFKMYLIPSSRPVTPFVIYFADLNPIPRIQQDFLEYCDENDPRNVTIFLKDVAGRFFENLDFEYYHSSIMKCLRVRLIS